MTAIRILLVEDDASLSVLLCNNLTYEGFAVDCVSDGSKALERIAVSRPDLVLLDVMIPGLDGFQVCRALSSNAERVPIIMLTALTQKQDMVRGLELGADDYVTKPFTLDELLARIHAVLRRTRQTRPLLTLGDVVIDFSRLRASKRSTEFTLTRREFAFLERLAQRRGSVVSRDELLKDVWGYRETPITRSVDIFVARLRRKIELDPQHPRFIRTAHGDGYCLALDCD
jgi:two-component system alkaline phosphatase synthesis response regulator PhoP